MGLSVKSIVLVVWAELTTIQRVFVLVMGLIFLFFVSTVIFLSIRTFSQSTQLKSLRTHQIDSIDKERVKHEHIIKMYNDSLISKNEAIILRDNRIKELNDELTKLADDAAKIPFYVSSLDSTGILNELGRIRATYHLN